MRSTRHVWSAHCTTVLYPPGRGRNPLPSASARSFLSPATDGSIGPVARWTRRVTSDETDGQRRVPYGVGPHHVPRRPPHSVVTEPYKGGYGRGDSRGPRLHVPSPSPIPFRRWEPSVRSYARLAASGGRPTPGTPRSRLSSCSAMSGFPFFTPWSINLSMVELRRGGN